MTGTKRFVVERVVFTDAAGRRLTAQDLAGFTGRVRWEIIGSDHVPADPESARHRAGIVLAGAGHPYMPVRPDEPAAHGAGDVSRPGPPPG